MNADPRELALLIASKMTRDAEAEADRLDPRLAYDDFSEAIRMIEVPVKPTGRVGSDDASYAYQCAEAMDAAFAATMEFAERLTRSWEHEAGHKMTPRADFDDWRRKLAKRWAEPLKEFAHASLDDRAESLRGRLVSSVNAGRR